MLFWVDVFFKFEHSIPDNTNVYQQEYQQGYVLAANGAGAEPQNDSFEDLLRKVKLEIESSQKHIK